MIKDKKSLKVSKSPSRRKFFAKAAVATGVVVAGGFLAGCEPKAKKAAAFFALGSHPAKNPPATTTPVATAALAKNFLLEGDLLTFRDFLSLIIISPLLVFVN